MTTRLTLDLLNCPLDGVNLIEASAGTGKTWTICNLYLRLLLERDYTVEQILVVTFTKAATAELRERIRTRIIEFSKELANAGLGRDELLTAYAARAIARFGNLQSVRDRLDLALQSFDEAAIDTIHSFCQRAVADMPFSAGVPLTTELLDDDRELRLEAVNDFWRRHIAADSMTPNLARYLLSKKPPDSPDVYATLFERQLLKPLAKLKWPRNIGTPLLDGAALGLAYRQARSVWSAHKDTIVNLISSSTALHANVYKKDGILTRAEQWSRLFDSEDALGNAGDKPELFGAASLLSKTKKNQETPQHAFFQLTDDYLQARKELEQSLALARLRLLQTLFDQAASSLRDLKSARQVISFSDMLSNLHDCLTRGQFPHLAAAIRTRFPAALIDEFQDTDPVQLDVFRTIYAADAHVFIVGDPKQAIYSFRQADLHTYLQAKKWADRETSLSHNQRSTQPLLAALNALFTANSNAFILPGVDYLQVDYGAKPRVSLKDDSAVCAPLQLWLLPADPPLPKNPARLAAAKATAAEIARLIDAASSGQITLDGRPLRPRDIAVLVRTRSLGSAVKRALAEFRVGAVEIVRETIFQTPDARDLVTVMAAILAPARMPLLRAALSTALFGCDAGAIEALLQDETALLDRARTFVEYRTLWIERGFGVMYRRLLTDQEVAKRMLVRRDGERRLTNLLHLGECLQQAAEVCDTPDALLRHLRSERVANNAADVLQLRLESDENLVQIVTVHGSKGLEYPIVFCPFLCDGTTHTPPGPEGLEYHDEDGNAVIDLCSYEKSSAVLANIDSVRAKERAAETVRLLYVALTRASHRCYLVVGPYRCNNSDKESSHSMLNWLIAGSGMSISQWLHNENTPHDVASAWRDFARQREGVGIESLPTPATAPRRTAEKATRLTALVSGALPCVAWRISSYSDLNYGAGERAAGDHDARVDFAPHTGARGLPMRIATPGVAHAGDILDFPRGAAAGECIHTVFETIDFGSDLGWPEAIAGALAAFPLSSDPAQRGHMSAMLQRMVRDVTATALRPGLRLASIPQQKRLTELEFTFPVPELRSRELNANLNALGYPMPALQFGRLSGYLKGFIDLIFEHDGRFYVLDWKSNYLGDGPSDYGTAGLAAAMQDHGYHLQYLLYTLALDRYLRSRIAHYHYDTHVGGVLYLFVRGVRPDWPGHTDEERPGVYFHRPSAATLRKLDALLHAPFEARS